MAFYLICITYLKLYLICLSLCFHHSATSKLIRSCYKCALRRFRVIFVDSLFVKLHAEIMQTNMADLLLCRTTASSAASAMEVRREQKLAESSPYKKRIVLKGLTMSRDSNRTLDVTQEHSPRNNLGRRWQEFHGSDDWSALLDPLDENLRREVVRYGDFVHAAYQSFHSNPKVSREEEDQFPLHVPLPDRSYRVTKSLYATSSIGMPKWVFEMSQQTRWIGYVAVCEDIREIERMGRRDVVIALRGTSTCLEWAENMRAELVPLDATSSNESPKVGRGFLSLFQTPGTNSESLAGSVVEEVRRLTDQYKGENLSITVAGHSLGAALALLVSDRIATRVSHTPPIAVVSFGGPRVGNRSFADQLNAKKVKVLRIVNSHDVVTKLPMSYSHVGTELRVHTKMSPYLKANADVACSHDLEAYLHLVDGFLSSDGPFRATSKRSLVKLLNYKKT